MHEASCAYGAELPFLSQSPCTEAAVGMQKQLPGLWLPSWLPWQLSQYCDVQICLNGLIFGDGVIYLKTKRQTKDQFIYYRGSVVWSVCLVLSFQVFSLV